MIRKDLIRIFFMVIINWRSQNKMYDIIKPEADFIQSPVYDAFDACHCNFCTSPVPLALRVLKNFSFSMSTILQLQIAKGHFVKSPHSGEREHQSCGPLS